MTFSIGMKGVEHENVEKVESLIVDMLQQLANDGVEPDMIW